LKLEDRCSPFVTLLLKKNHHHCDENQSDQPFLLDFDHFCLFVNHLGISILRFIIKPKNHLEGSLFWQLLL
jgi:hypothetical protein